MSFEEELSDLINKHLRKESRDAIISGMELHLIALKEDVDADEPD